jgi:hypothetical protein
VDRPARQYSHPHRVWFARRIGSCSAPTVRMPLFLLPSGTCGCTADRALLLASRHRDCWKPFAIKRLLKMCGVGGGVPGRFHANGTSVCHKDWGTMWSASAITLGAPRRVRPRSAKPFTRPGYRIRVSRLNESR